VGEGTPVQDRPFRSLCAEPMFQTRPCVADVLCRHGSTFGNRHRPANSPAMPAGWTSSQATESRKLPIMAVAQRRTIACPSPVPARPGGGQYVPVRDRAVIWSPAGISTRSASRAVNSLPSAAMASHWSAICALSSVSVRSSRQTSASRACRPPGQRAPPGRRCPRRKPPRRPAATSRP